MSMDAKLSQKMMSVIKAYRKKLPITTFVYGDFIEVFPDIIQSWSNQDNIMLGIRESHQYPQGTLENMDVNWIREGVVSSKLRLSELNIASSFYFPSGTSENVIDVAKSQRMTIIQPSASFPPRNGMFHTLK